ncbi:PREDICTED: cytochrome P450 4C1-like [Polistes dominula]|uniref:Cytochrome P450 4C1-like n=1 Tax=Polistes dominula TaxID=743375 RepID=A0ABM1J6X3_POLDO|nr:PREDICTED: cytochrome P450 4C1-like [Polistes dominula]
MFLTIFLSSIVLLILLHCKIKYGRIGRILNSLPGPDTYPIIGNLHHIKDVPDNVIKKIVEYNNKYFPIYKISTFGYYMVFLLHPDDIKVLMTSTENIDKEHVYYFLRPWLSYGLLTSTGKKWQKRRKMLTPAFHFKILEHSVITFNKEAHCLIKSLKQESEGNAVIKNLQSLITRHTLNIICETALGISLKEKKEHASKYRDAIHSFGKIVPYRLLRPWFYIEWIFALSSVGRLHKRALNTLHSFSRNIIAERKLFHEKTNRKYLYQFEKTDNIDTSFQNSEEKNTNSIYKKRLSMLDLLIAYSLDSNEIDDKGIQEEVDTFMFEGHDTTSMALIFALSLFAKHQDVQQRIRDEVNAIMLDDDYDLTTSDLQELSYLDRCIKESLRLYPSVPFISRTLTHDLQLNNSLIPSGTICAIYIYSVHRNPRYWPDPNVFDPDRFLPENVKGHYPFSYIPFSAGPRNCIGQKYAMLELKLIVAHIVRNFYLEPVDNIDDVEITVGLTLNSSKPLHVKFIPVNEL